MQPWLTPFLIWNHLLFHCSSPVLTVASWLAHRFLRTQVRWSGIPIYWRILTVCCDPHRQRLSHSQWSRSRCFSRILLLFRWSNGCWPFDLWFFCLFYIQLKHLEISWFTYYWGLTWRILSITLIICKMSAIGGSLNILWHCPSLVLEWKRRFPVLWPLLSFPNLLAYCAQHFHSIIF